MNKELQEAIAIAKEAAQLLRNDGIISIEANRVHLTRDFFEKNIPCRERSPHGDAYEQISVFVDDVRVFCLVPIEKPEAPIAHQSV